jgi:hypothetical protein
MGFGLMIGFIGLFLNTAHDYTLQFTDVHSHIFTSRCSVAAFNGGHSPSYGFPNYPYLINQILRTTVHED